jgi:hypothetical protein
MLGVVGNCGAVETLTLNSPPRKFRRPRVCPSVLGRDDGLLVRGQLVKTVKSSGRADRGRVDHGRVDQHPSAADIYQVGFTSADRFNYRLAMSRYSYCLLFNSG